MQQWSTGTGSGLPACCIQVTLCLGSVREGLQSLPALILGEAYNPMTHKLVVLVFCVFIFVLLEDSLADL